MSDTIKHTQTADGFVNNRTAYNRIAKRWSDVRKGSFISKLVVDFADRIVTNGTILDIGCGSGLPLTKYLSEKGFCVTGIDSAEEMIAIAKASSIDRANFMVNDFFNYTTTNKFDAVLAWDSLWHFPKDKQHELYTKIGNMLSKGGYFLFTHGNVDGEHVDTMMGEQFYYSSLSEQEIYKQLGQAGFKVEYAHIDFIENNTHRAFVALARKI